MDDDLSDATMMDYLKQYGYLLRQPNGYRWLGGFLRGSQLQHARLAIEARYPATVPLLYVVEHPRGRKRIGQRR